MDPDNLARLALQCQNSLNACLALPGVSKGQFGHLLEDQRGLFNTWAANTNVFARSRASLEYRLREAPYVKGLVRELLTSIEEVITDSLIETLKASEREFTDDPDHDTDKDDVFFQDTKPFIEACIDSIMTDIGLLQQMSHAIRYASTSRQNKEAAAPERLQDASTFFAAMRYLVRDRFPFAQKDIVDRLALSMTIRRNRLLYRRNRFQGQGVQLTSPEEIPRQVASRSHEPSRLPTGLPARQPTVDIGLNTGAARSTTRTGTAVNQERYQRYSAPSTVADSRLQTAKLGKFQYPPIPEPSQNGQTVCPYCWLYLTATEIRTPAKWITHLEGDLDQFVCLYDTCDLKEEFVLFERKNEWIDHMRKSHGIRWRCLACKASDEQYTEKRQMETHIRECHPSTFQTEHDLAFLVDGCATQPSEIFGSCPLCGFTDDSYVNLESHVTDHLKALALTTLWQYNRETEANHGNDDDSNETSTGRDKTRTTIKEAFSENLDLSKEGWTPPSEDQKLLPSSSEKFGDLGIANETLPDDVEQLWIANRHIDIRQTQWWAILQGLEEHDGSHTGDMARQTKNLSRITIEDGTILDIEATSEWLFDSKQYKASADARAHSVFEFSKVVAPPSTTGRENEPHASNSPQLSEPGRMSSFGNEDVASLAYTEMNVRSEQIVTPSAKCYEWIFDEESPLVDFISWLQRNEGGIFWMSGKAGSGKSTIMKHISDDSRTLAALKNWGGSRRVVIGSHYFWSSGSIMQKNIAGLLRSILYQALLQCPEAIDTVCSSRNEKKEVPWSLSELHQGIQRLSDKTSGSDCFCYFVDELDGYDGDHEELVKTIKWLSSIPNFKICVASRPWEVFQDAFEDSLRKGDSISLHMHTRSDILQYIEQEFGNELREEISSQDMAEDLVQEILDKAEGVFLWVTIAIKSLKQSLRDGDDLERLRQSLRAIPSDLVAFFQQLLDRHDPLYQRQTARILLTCLRADELLPANAIEVMMSEDPAADIAASRFSLHSCSDAEVYKVVNARCPDLLQLHLREPHNSSGERYISDDSMWRIHFVHQGVRDFLERRDTQEILVERSGEQFSAEVTLLAIYVYLIKFCSNRVNKPFHTALGWALSALRYAAHLEGNRHTFGLLEQLDEAMNNLSNVSVGHHWTNCFNLIRPVDRELGTITGRYIDDRGHRNYLATLIELGLTSYVREKLTGLSLSQRKSVRKSGRPYLDYALRSSPFAQWWLQKFPPSPRPELIEVLLMEGGDVNEKIEIYRNLSVWELFLLYLSEYPELRADGEQVTWLLIQNGAANFNRKPFWSLDHPRRSMEELLIQIFGAQVGRRMTRSVLTNERK